MKKVVITGFIAYSLMAMIFFIFCRIRSCFAISFQRSQQSR